APGASARSVSSRPGSRDDRFEGAEPAGAATVGASRHGPLHVSSRRSPVLEHHVSAMAFTNSFPIVFGFPFRRRIHIRDGARGGGGRTSPVSHSDTARGGNGTPISRSSASSHHLRRKQARSAGNAKGTT